MAKIPFAIINRYLSIAFFWRRATTFAVKLISVDNSFTHVPYSDTGYFSSLVTDYLALRSDIAPFFNYSFTEDDLSKAIRDRSKFPVNRRVLVAALQKQYSQLEVTDAVQNNIDALLNEHTYTVCTAHQPNLLTGYLYFVYKIMHAIKLAEQLNERYPDKRFVPVYYMGSEDNDLDELGTFRFRGEKFMWDGDGQSGAVGRMNTSGLKKMLNDLCRTFGPPGNNCDTLTNILTTAYLKHKTIGAATRYLVNELFGRYGLVVLDPDDQTLKAQFIPVMQDELLNSTSLPILTAQTDKLSAHYKVQAYPRPINIFYLAEQLRERIEKHGDRWVVINTGQSRTEDELITELNEHPERFSPNVMLRGLYQETILPDVAFIGGGAEVAYWMQLKTLFSHYDVFFPSIHLRQSVLWSNEVHTRLRKQLELSINDLFKDEGTLIATYVAGHTQNEWQTGSEAASLEQLFRDLKQKAMKVDPTLKGAADAALAKMKRQLDILEKKMLKAEKKKMSTQVARISKLKTGLFPNKSLQERVENFMEYYLQYGPAFFDTIKDGTDALNPRFLIIEQTTA